MPIRIRTEEKKFHRDPVKGSRIRNTLFLIRSGFHRRSCQSVLWIRIGYVFRKCRIKFKVNCVSLKLFKICLLSKLIGITLDPDLNLAKFNLFGFKTLLPIIHTVIYKTLFNNKRSRKKQEINDDTVVLVVNYDKMTHRKPKLKSNPFQLGNLFVCELESLGRLRTRA